MATKLLDEIRKSNKKPKELLVFLADLIKKDPHLLDDFEDSVNNAADAERGTCIESLEYATQENPELAVSHIKTVISCLGDKAPRVKWEAARVIGNIAQKCPEEAIKAIDALMINTRDKGTVVRWSTAFALGEILKSSERGREALKEKIDRLVNEEDNNGVKNVYLKALKAIKTT